MAKIRSWLPWDPSNPYADDDDLNLSPVLEEERGGKGKGNRFVVAQSEAQEWLERLADEATK